MAFPTVLPGQLPVCCLSPVRALKTVLFPVLGLPARAIVKRVPSVCSPRRWREALPTGQEEHEAQELVVCDIG